MNELQLVSVGIPTYNGVEGLRRTLKCITNQTYKHLEIIVSDNCSENKETEKIVKNFMNKDSRIRYFKQKRNMGMSFNFKFVLENAKGKYFMWAADDDEWEEKFIEECLKKFDDKTILVAVTHKTIYRANNKCVNAEMPYLDEKNTQYQNLANFLLKLTPNIIYGLWDRQLLTKIFMVNKQNTFDFYDCYIIIRALCNHKVKIVHQYLYTVGIMEDVYQKKATVPTMGRMFFYKPFFISVSKSILFIPKMSLIKKLLLLMIHIKTCSGLYLHHEIEFRNNTFQKQITYSFINFINKLSFLTVDKMRQVQCWSNDLISVIIPTYNRANSIERVIQSVLKQSVFTEVLVCDDGSTDNTEKIVKSINDSRVKWVPGKHSGLPAVPRNRGLKEAKGEWIAFLDSDDEWLPNKLEQQLKSTRVKNVKAVCSNANMFKPKVGIVGLLSSYNKKKISFEDLLFGNPIICSSVFINKKIIQSFPEESSLKALEDYALWLRIATKNKFIHIKKPLLNYTDDKDNSIRKDKDIGTFDVRKIIFKNYLSWAKKNFVKPGLIKKVKKHYKLSKINKLPERNTYLDLIKKFKKFLK